MDPVKLNTLITYFSNYLFCSLNDRSFYNLGLFLSLLSKEMLTMEAVKGLCEPDPACGGEEICRR